MGFRLTVLSSVAEAYELASSISPLRTDTPSLAVATRRVGLDFLDLVCVILMRSRSDPPFDRCLLLGVRRTRTLGFRCSPEPDEPPALPPSKYSMSSEVCDLLARCPALMVTGVPSSGSEYEDCSSPGFETSVPTSLGGAVRTVELVSVGAGSGGADLFLLSTAMIVDVLRASGQLLVG
jgi:hypothetical protein